MTIKLRTTLCGPAGTLQPGEHTLEPAREQSLVAAGCAEYVKAPRQAESAIARTAENTALNRTSRRRAKE